VKTDVGVEEKEVFAAYLVKNRLKRSEQREVILDTFLRSERHLSVDDLLRLVQKRRPDIGRTTVYRTLKLLQAAGLATELVLQGQTRFEREYKREHHDHFICKQCGEIFEFASPEIERIQDEIAAEIGFVIDGHRHQIFGFCRERSAAKGHSAARS
jgi:Fur family transcriptional regulator, ferric uptake regulator